MKLIDIKPISLFPDYAPILAHWSYKQWYLKRSIDFVHVLNSYMDRAKDDYIPLSYLAINNTLPVGMVSLKENDLWSRKDLNPWLASLYVLPEFRNRGIGEMLISAVINKSRNTGLKKIFLFLDQTEINQLSQYYRKRGWKFYEKGIDNDGCETEIYYYNIS